jgi:hypothetical protein
MFKHDVRVRVELRGRVVQTAAAVDTWVRVEQRGRVVQTAAAVDTRLWVERRGRGYESTGRAAWPWIRGYGSSCVAVLCRQ